MCVCGAGSLHAEHQSERRGPPVPAGVSAGGRRAAAVNQTENQQIRTPHSCFSSVYHLMDYRRNVIVVSAVSSDGKLLRVFKGMA